MGGKKLTGELKAALIWILALHTFLSFYLIYPPIPPSEGWWIENQEFKFFMILMTAYVVTVSFAAFRLKKWAKYPLISFILIHTLSMATGDLLAIVILVGLIVGDYFAFIHFKNIFENDK